jgi:hypothetical protein
MADDSVSAETVQAKIIEAEGLLKGFVVFVEVCNLSFLRSQ